MKSFMMSDRCDSCRGDCIIIEVKRSVYGLAMYLADLTAAILIVLYVAKNDFDVGFLGTTDNGLYLAFIFGLIIASFVLAFIDLGRTNEEARRIVEERKGRVKD